MYLLRTNVSTKLIDNEGYLEALFGYDPDPQTRPDYRTEALKEEFAQAAQNPLADKARYVRCHRLSSLRGSPGRSDTWTEEYYNAFREAQLEYGYGIYKGSEDGVCLLRYSKLNPDGISITTKIVFADPQFWYDNVEPHYMKLELLLQKHFVLDGTTSEITPEDYAALVAEIRNDINDMKSGGTTRCRLDFINEITN